MSDHYCRACEVRVPTDFPYCSLCGNVNRADLGPVTGMCLDGRACRRRQAGLEPVNPDERPMPEEWVHETAYGIEDWRPTDA